MPKTVCVLLACLVLAAGQAAKRDTTQWRCRNRKLSCKRWAADNQCTANYPFMEEELQIERESFLKNKKEVRLDQNNLDE